MDYAAAFLAVAGTWLLARKSWLGWPAYTLCSCLWIAWGLWHVSYGIVIQNAALLPFEVAGWWKWRKA